MKQNKNIDKQLIQEPESVKSYNDLIMEQLISNLQNGAINNKEIEDIKIKNYLSKRSANEPTHSINNLLSIVATNVGTDIADSLKQNWLEEGKPVDDFLSVARALALAVEVRDPYTGGHSGRVFGFARELGKRCKIETNEQMLLEVGALLHDVGKIGIRDGVLLKPGALTESEYKEMQLHTIIGAHIVQQLDCLGGSILAVLFHHERIDGYGYPFGLKGDEIPLIAKITSVADAYDAMTTNRIYRKALSHEEAIKEVIKNSGTQFDPEIVKVFVGIWEDLFSHKKTELYI